MNEKTRIDPETGTEVVDFGPSPAVSERAWKPMRERFGDDFAAAHEEACKLSDELARLYNDESLLAKPFDRRLARFDEIIARAQERVANLKGRRAALEANREAALEPNRTSRAWRLARLDEFRRDYNAYLRLAKAARSLRLTGGKLTFTRHKPKEKLIEQIGADGNVLAGRIDEAALMEVLSVLRRCGLHNLYEPLVVTSAKLALSEVKKRLKLTNSGPVFEAFVKGRGDDLRERVEAEGGSAWPQVERTTGEIIGWTVTFRAVQVIRDPNSGEVIMERPLLREVAPPEEWTLGFLPSEPGQVPQEEDETDGD